MDNSKSLSCALIMQWGNYSDICSFIDNEPNLEGSILYKEAICCGNLPIVKYISKKGYYLFVEYIVDAIDNNQYDIAKWILNEKNVKSIDEVIIHANIKTLEWLYEKGYRITHNTLEHACYNDDSKVLEWLIARGGSVHTDLWYISKRLYKISHMIILHRTGNKDILEKAHINIKKCIFCIKENKERINCLTELWIMDEERYDNVIQCLPRETLEDTIALI